MKNTLMWDGVDLEYLANKYGTPLYVYSVSAMEDKINQLKKAFIEKYPKARIAYASKAFLNKAMVGLIKSQGLSLDAVSLGELQIALKAGMDAQDIEFNGNNKLHSELEYAIKHRVGRIIVDSKEELEYIERFGRQYNYRVPVLFRVTPGININSHKYIITGSKDSKFGLPLDDSLVPHLKRVLESDYMDFYGFHFHLGSQLMDNHTYLQSLELVFEFIDKYLENKLIKELNIGGGGWH